MPQKHFDAIVVGGGHNGLVSATFLARQGLDVLVLEEKTTVGGAVKTENPFAKAPLLGTSTGSYLLGVMPPELLMQLGINLPLVRRDPHYFLPTLDNRYLLFGSDADATRRQFTEFFSADDWDSNQALIAEISKIRDDIAPTWLEEPLSLQATAEKYVRPELKKVFVDLCTRPVEEYLDRFNFKSDILLAMYAVTDAFSGLNASFGTPGAGHNFLVHNMCRLPGSDGTFMIVKGGMGTISRELARCAVQAERAFLRKPLLKKFRFIMELPKVSFSKMDANLRPIRWSSMPILFECSIWSKPEECRRISKIASMQ